MSVSAVTMSVFRFCLSAALVLVCNTIFAQAVQLPTFQVFSVDTSVLVPDRGQAYLGGVKRARSGSTTRGIPGLSGLPYANRLTKNRGIGLERSATGAYVTATIIDNAELDRQVRARATRPAALPVHQVLVQQRADFLAKHLARPAADTDRHRTHNALANPPDAAEALAQIRKQNALAHSQRQAKAHRYIAKGKAAEKAGKRSLARTYYKMAAKDADEDIRRQLIARIQYLQDPTADQLVQN
ncbi:MAG TPA: hypothetical protein DCY79_21400 [Planctomycetaceae bacterium]|mgnify:CR=1 FL=1|nr:hypothetical protein [Blastopirellula sp.]HAY82372.1 hypothetical protein [Planctomycetaceae bacterium]